MAGLVDFNEEEVTIMRDRGSVVIIEDRKVGLIKRIRHSSVYYVFPGGGIREVKMASLKILS